MPQITIGVDVGKGSHRAAAWSSTTGRITGQLTFSVSPDGFARFLAFLEHLAPDPDEMLVGLEASGHYHWTLVEFLAEHGYSVALINPFQAARFRQSQGKKAKTDRIDAQALARFLAVSAPQPVSLPSEALTSLRELTRFRADLVRTRTAALNRLHGALDLAFPELRKVLGSINSPTVLALLQMFPTAAAVAAADVESLTEVMRTASQGQIGAERAAVVATAAKNSIAVRRMEPALRVKVRTLAHQVEMLNREIAEIDTAIIAGFALLGYRPEQFPAGGAISLATILAEAGDVGRYPSAKHFLSHFGWCPVDTQSGQYKDAHPRLSRAGNRYVRRIIWMLAVGAVRHPGPYRDYFEQRTRAGKNKMDSLVAIGRKLLTTIYAILKTGDPYDPAYCLADPRSSRSAVI